MCGVPVQTRLTGTNVLRGVGGGLKSRGQGVTPLTPFPSFLERLWLERHGSWTLSLSKTSQVKSHGRVGWSKSYTWKEKVAPLPSLKRSGLRCMGRCSCYIKIEKQSDMDLSPLFPETMEILIHVPASPVCRKWKPQEVICGLAGGLTRHY